jgi:predicted acyl esterase
MEPNSTASIAGIPTIFKDANHDFSKIWRSFRSKREILPAGWRKDEGRRALPEDLVFEQDVAITLRDGVVIYADIFRPVSSDKTPVPGILAWSPYGKQGNGMPRPDQQPPETVSSS